jgi:hypothetical protein
LDPARRIVSLACAVVGRRRWAVVRARSRTIVRRRRRVVSARRRTIVRRIVVSDRWRGIIPRRSIVRSIRRCGQNRQRRGGDLDSRADDGGGHAEDRPDTIAVAIVATTVAVSVAAVTPAGISTVESLISDGGR